MKINMAHLRTRATNGGWINFAVFDAQSSSGDNAGALMHLTAAARRAGLKVDQSALAYSSGGQLRFFGDKNLVAYLSRNWSPQWTHKIDA